MSDIKKITNSNTIPLVDELVYYSKIICRDIEIKDQTSANKYESLDSIKNSDLYIKCLDSKANISNFSYSRDELLSYGLDSIYIDGYLESPLTIPSTIQKTIINIIECLMVFQI